MCTSKNQSNKRFFTIKYLYLIFLVVYIADLGRVWFLKSNKEKNVKENNFLIFDCLMKNVKENQN